MPRIDQYTPMTDAPAPVSQPNQDGEAFGAQVAEQQARTGRAMAEAGDEVMGLGAHIARRAGQAEVSDLAVTMAETQADFTQKLHDTLKNASPGDQNITEDFIKEYQASVDKIQDGITTPAGQQYFNRINARVLRHLTDSANAGQAELAGVQAVQNIDTSTKALEKQLQLDPASYWPTDDKPGVKDFARDNVESIAAGNLDAKQKSVLQSSVQTRLAEAAVRGWIETSPQEAMNQLSEGKWSTELDSNKVHQLMSEAKVGLAGEKAQARQQEADQEKALTASQELTKNQFLARLVDPGNPAGKYKVKDILNSNLDFTDKKLFINMMDADDGKQTTNQGIFNSMLSRSILPEGDPRRISDPNVAYRASSAGQLTFADAQKLAQLIQGRRTDQGELETHLRSEFMKSAAPQIDHSNPGLNQFDLDGASRLYKFNYFVEKSIATQKAQNKPVENLYNPASPDFLGVHIKQFQVGPEDIMKQMMRNAGGSSGDVGDITKMSAPELRKLDPKSLTPDQKKQAHDRFESLREKP